jgi:hypothetical protein
VQARGTSGAELGLQLIREIAWVVTGLYSFTGTRDNLARGLDGERIVALTRQLVHRRQVAQPHSPKATEDGRTGKAGTAFMVGVASAASATVDDDFVVLGPLVESGEQSASFRLDDGLLVGVAGERSNRVERLEPSDRDESDLLAVRAAEQVRPEISRHPVDRGKHLLA